ncbi:hypothetical protein [Planococcus sp. SSTMD024]|uniref:hypothetical protein n=1 Tax=Planococcus sp. SSTMD024 TaxID=3242163 RepID=UPI00351E6954
MEATQQELIEIIKLKKKQLLWGNLFMLVIFLLFGYLLGNGKILFVTWILIVFLLIMTVLSLYTLITGTIIGTKTMRRIQTFDRKRWGKKKWKRTKIIEIVLFTGLGIGMSVFVFNTEFDSSNRNLSSFSFPFLGAWIGYNLGEIIRIAGLKEQSANG